MATTNTYIPPISIPGIGTSIDVNTLVTKLMQAEGKGMVVHQNQQKVFQAQLSAGFTQGRTVDLSDGDGQPDQR